MLAELFQKISLFYFLNGIDEDLSDQSRAARCPHCGGPLHQGNYHRKPRGGPENIPDELKKRYSLCCGRSECRKRVLPPSCRFMGRKVYWSCVILIVMALRQNRPESYSSGRVRQLFGISRKTLGRWQVFFREVFPVSGEWQRLRGRISSQVKDHELPGGLLNLFFSQADNPEKGLADALVFLASG